MKSFDKDCLFMNNNQLNNFIYLLKKHYKNEVMAYDHFAIDDNIVAFFYLISYIFPTETIKKYVEVSNDIFSIWNEHDSLPKNHFKALSIAYDLSDGNIGIDSKQDIPDGFETLVLNAIDIMLSEYEISNDKKIQLISLTAHAIENKIVKLVDDEVTEKIEDYSELER